MTPSLTRRAAILGGGGFTPKQLSSLQLWLDASNAGSLQTDGAVQLTAINNEYLQCASNSTLQTGNVDFWVAAWVYLDDVTTATKTLVSKETGGNNSEYRLVATSTPRFRMKNGTAVTGPVLSVSTWYFILAWYDSVNQTINIQINNGTVTSTSFTAGITATTDPLMLGYSGFGSEYHNGRLDSVAFGKSPPGGIAGIAAALSTALYNGGSGLVYNNLTAAQKTAWGLVSWWNLSEEFGTRYDSFGTNNLTETFNPIISPTVNNGGFETAGSPFANWSTSVAGTSTVTRDTISPHSGTADCQFTIDSSNSLVNVSQSSLLVLNKKYTASLYAKASSAAGSPSLQVNGNSLNALTTSYAQYSITFVTSSQNFAIARGGNCNSLTLNIDDVTLTAAQILGAVGITQGQATVSGDAVSTWLDQSGQSNNPVQTTGSKRPTLQLAQQNGLPGIQYDGVDDFLLAPTEIGGQSGLTVFAVCKSIATFPGSITQFILSTQNNGGQSGWRIYYAPDSAGHQVWRGGSAAGGTSAWIAETGGSGTFANSTTVYSATYQPGAQALYRNGTLSASGSSNNVHDLTGGGTAVGANVVGNANSILAGLIFEIIVYNRALSDGERQKVEKYLRNKWGTP